MLEGGTVKHSVLVESLQCGTIDHNSMLSTAAGHVQIIIWLRFWS